MGTFLCEEISSENVFDDCIKKELHDRVVDILLEFGECALEEISLYGTHIYVYNPQKLMKKENEYILSYNRFEGCNWEPAYMKVSADDFDGIHSSSIGSKVGYKQHYVAMAISRILCECYSNGNYCVYGDIGSAGIKQCLAYIGKKYGFELVERFVKCRTDFALMKNKENYNELYWGVSYYDYYFKRYEDMTFDSWEEYIRREFADDLEKAQNEGDSIFCGTRVYLGSLFMKCVCETELTDKLKLGKEQLLIALNDLIREYYINPIEKKQRNYPVYSFDISQCSELNKYRLYYENMEKLEYMESVGHKSFLYKSVKSILEKTQREDFKEIIDEFHKMLDSTILSEGYDTFLSLLRQTTPEKQEERTDFLIKSIYEIAEKPEDIRSILISDRYLKELFFSVPSVTTMSKELDGFLRNIFSRERLDRFTASVCKAEQPREELSGVKRLLNLADRLLNDSEILFSSDLFYHLLERSASEKGVEIINKIDFYLADLPEQNQKRAFLSVIQNDELREKYCFGEI